MHKSPITDLICENLLALKLAALLT